MVTDIAFIDGSEWKCSGLKYYSVPQKVLLETVIADKELQKQFKMQYGMDSMYYPKQYKHLWMCSCGTAVINNQDTCYHCGRKKSKLLPVNINKLKEDKEKRLAEEKEAQEKKEAAIKNAIKIAITVAIIIATFTIFKTSILPKIKYNNACKLLNNGEYSQAKNAFQLLDGYNDSNDKIQECVNGENYILACEIMDSGDYFKAMEAFRTTNNYLDSDIKIEECRSALYDNARIAMSEEKYADAIDIFTELYGYKDSAEQIIVCITAIKDRTYEEAEALYLEGQYKEAIEAYQKLYGYKDSTQKISDIRHDFNYFKTLEVGDMLYFGYYEQDNNSDNGKESIEWTIISKEDNRILILSDCVLDYQKYHVSNSSVSWENCFLRTWLNNEFLYTAFNETEQSIIEKANVSNQWNSSYKKVTNNTTTDKVFLLSESEVGKYLDSDDRACKPTAFAEANGAYGNPFCDWWLRTPAYAPFSYDQTYARLFDDDDNKITSLYNNREKGIRPALWINIS